MVSYLVRADETIDSIVRADETIDSIESKPDMY